MEKETYLAQTMCGNCGYRNYPQWQSFKKGEAIVSASCLSCGVAGFLRAEFHNDCDTGTTQSFIAPEKETKSS